jgi:GDPmannose 4,6-dehydratase
MHTVREFLDTAFSLVGLDADDHLVIDPRYFRPTEVDELCGDAGKAARLLGWRPTTTFTQLVRIMVEADLHEAGIDPITVMASSTTGSG